VTDNDNQIPLTGIQRNTDYTLLSPLGGQTAHIRFQGPFLGKEVTWDTHLITLQKIYQQGISAGTFAANEKTPVSQFIDINKIAPAEYALTIGIDVPVIDAPTVLKTIIMIHNYKRLRPGRHEYGPSRQFP
jgi:hypothetical protein